MKVLNYHRLQDLKKLGITRKINYTNELEGYLYDSIGKDNDLIYEEITAPNTHIL